MVLVLLLANQTDASRLGAVLAVYSVASILASISDLGLGTLILRAASSGNTDKANSAVRLAGRTTTLLSSIFAVLLGLMVLDNHLLLPTVPLVLWSGIERATETRNMTTLAVGGVGKVGLLVGGRRALSLLIFVMLIFAIGVDATWAFSIALLGPALCGYLLSVKWSPVDTTGSNFRDRDLLREALPFTINTVSGQLRNADVPIVAATLGTVAAGAYGLGARIASPLLLIYSSIANLLIARVQGNSRRMLARRSRAAVLVGFLTAALIAAVVLSSYSIVVVFVPWLSRSDLVTIAIISSTFALSGTAIVLGSLATVLLREARAARINLVLSVVTLLVLIALALVTNEVLYVAAGSFTLTAARCVLLHQNNSEKGFRSSVS